MAEGLANLPAEEQPTEEMLRKYTPKYLPENSFAWGPLFPQAAMYLNDIDKGRKKKKDQPTPGGGAFDYQATDGW